MGKNIATDDSSLFKNPGNNKFDKEILSLKVEREKSTKELIIANKELAFQNNEKEKRAAELIIANKELAFQNSEKEKRAAELIIANKELAFQNGEKEKRATELIIVNEELKEAQDRITELNISLEQRITERTLQLELANKELESFSYSVSHDLRAPLRAINSFTQILIEECQEKLDDENKSILNEIVENSKRMNELIETLLEYSHSGKQNVLLVNVQMKELVDSVIKEQRQEQANRSVKINVNALENIAGDRNMLRQVFINLISNALKYSSKKETAVIEIGSYLENSQCIYYVKDNGAGFDMQYYDKLFGVFQRLHSNNEFEGTGVGLAIVHRVITKHGGKVWAQATEGEGACFYISLPSAR
jgi:light-regulated signal transduction histidine kinase (bacteriophytochrome)